jgi:plastocyanin
MPGLFTGCLTCTTLFKGFAEPGTTVSINADGISGDSLSAVVDAQGFWQIEALLAGGINQIELGWTGCLTCTVYAGLADAGIAVDGSYIFGEELSLTVDRSLFWNPNSFGYTRTTLEELQGAAVTEADDSCGPWQIVDDAGRMELDNWRIPVWSGKEIELGVELFCETEPSAALKYLDQQVQFTDKDGDGYFTATFTPEIDDEVLAGVDSELSISCGDETAVYSGKMVPVQPVQVVDRDTGEPLAGMNVELFRANRATDAGNTGAGNAQFTAWEAHAFGQTNPQQTDGNGHFSYIVPRGRYGLVVTGDGYQPFRAGPVRGQGPITGFNIGMPPALSSAGNEVVQITEDGFLPAMLKVNAGTVVRWQNISLDTASTQSVADGVTGVAVNAAAWDSGLLLSGETHTVRFDKEGTYTYVDAADPSKTAIIQIVKPASPDGEEIFLPFMIR